jgi:hypothetical protein
VQKDLENAKPRLADQFIAGEPQELVAFLLGNKWGQININLLSA